MPSDPKYGVPGPSQGPEAFFQWLIDTMREPQDVHYEIQALTGKEYRFYALSAADHLRDHLIDPRVGSLQHGQTYRFAAVPGTDRIEDASFEKRCNYERLSGPGYQHHARLSFGEGNRVVITHVTSTKSKAYPILPHMHDFSMNAGKIDHRSFQEGFMQLGGRTVVSPEHAVEIFHRMHLSNVESYFDRSVRYVDLDRCVGA